MVTVEVDPVLVECRLAEGGIECSACGVLGGWWYARVRRIAGVSDPVRPQPLALNTLSTMRPRSWMPSSWRHSDCETTHLAVCGSRAPVGDARERQHKTRNSFGKHRVLHGTQSLYVFGGGGGEDGWVGTGAVARTAFRLQSRPSNRACGSPAHGSPTPFTGVFGRSPPGPVGPGCDDDAIDARCSTSLRWTLSYSAWNRRPGSALATRYSACKARTALMGSTPGVGD